MESARVITADTVDLRVSSSVAQDALPRRFSKHLTIPALKDKLELISGGCAASMQLSLYDCSDKFVCSVDSATLMLGAFPVQDGMRLHVHDKTIQNVSLDGSNVPQKFELTDDEYKSRKGTLRSFLEQTKQGKYDPEEAARMAAAREQKELQEKQQLASISLESRCEVRRCGQPTVRGVVRFVGATKFRPGVWVGVQLDEPLGKNNGSVESHSYFSCPDKYGIFVRPASVFCGDFPEISPMDEDEDEM